MSSSESAVEIAKGDFVDYLLFRWEVAEVMEEGGSQFLRLIMEGSVVPKVAAHDVQKVNPNTGHQFKSAGHLRLVSDRQD